MIIRIVFCLTVPLLLVACGSQPASSYVDDYRSAQARFPGSATEAQLTDFLALYQRLGGDDVGERVRRAYADELFFNDTLHTSYSADDLATYMEQTARRVDQVNVTVLDHWQRGVDVYVRWHMETAFTVVGKQRQSESVGITHLRFNDQGRIVLHQDFWDSAEGFYRHIPVSGQAINWVRGKL